MGKSRERFKQKTLDLWEERLGKDAWKFRFNEMLAVLNNVRASEKMSTDKISVKTQTLLDVYTFEKVKADAVKEFENRKE